MGSTTLRPWIRRLTLGAFLLAVPAAGAQELNRDPERVRFVLDDVHHFWEAFDARGALGTARAIDSLYFGRASAGLADFRRLRLSDVAGFVRAIDRAERYYASTRPSTQRIADAIPELRGMLRRFKSLYPDAAFPDVYFVVGRLSTGGTVGPSGLLIGAEMYGRTADSLLGPPLSDWHRAVLRPVDGIAAIVFHELVHFQQPQIGASLLAQSLREGIADFAGELVSGRNINDVAVAYLREHEDALRAEFAAAMDSTDVSRWLYNGSSSTDRPADLGYAVGYRIAASYHARAADKAAALARMLRLANEAEARRFLEESGWLGPGGTP